MRWLMREWRGGELGLLAVSLVTAVAIVSGITAFAERLNRGMAQESLRFMAADRVLLSPRPVAPEWLAEADRSGLERAVAVDFQSMVFAGDEMQLAAVKAVSSAYPLRGSVRVSDVPFGEDYVLQQGPSPGELWMDSRLFPLLDVAPGGMLGIGELELPVTRAVVGEPELASSFYAVGPRVMMHIDDLQASGVVQPGSLVQYRYLFAGDATALDAYRDWLEPRLEDSHKWQTLDESQPQIARTLQRAEIYLLLAGSFGVALAGVAVALAARRYSERHYDVVAVMKALGAGSGQVLRFYVSNLLLLTLLAAAIGCAIGWLVQFGMMAAISDLLNFTAPAAGWRPLVAGVTTGLICTLAFALPPVLSLQNVSPLRVLRRDFPVDGLSVASSTLLGLGGIALLMWWYARSLELALAVMLGVGLMLLLTTAVALQIFRGTRSLGMQAGSATKLALAALNRRRGSNAFQVGSFALALMVFLCLLVVRGSLLEEWRLQLPENTPNHFLMNIHRADVEPVEQFLADRGIESAGLYPMIRARLTGIGEQPLDQLAHIDREATAINREMNLSWAARLPEDNRLIAGNWWPQELQMNPGLVPVSIEESLAERLSVGVGSRLHFTVGGQPLDAEITSIRRLDWDSMRPNFFLLFPPQVLQDYPATFITSFYLPPEERLLLNQLVRAFPTMTLIEMDAIMAQVRTIVQQVSAGVELVMALVIFCALLVTIANVRASVDSRLHENAILRTLGASRRLISGSLWLEFAVLGTLAGLLAAAGAELSLYILQTQVLEMTFVRNNWLWLASPAIGALLIAGFGWWSCRQVVNTPPLAVLRGL